MKTVLVLLFLGYLIYAGIYLFLIAFRVTKPKFKSVEKKLRFERTFEKYHLLFKAAAIIYLVSFGKIIWDSGVLKRLFQF